MNKKTGYTTGHMSNIKKWS